MTPSLPVLYEDNHCLAVLKSAGQLMVGDRTGDESLLDGAKSYLKEKFQKPGDVYLGVVHRLDRPVSGVALFARTSKAAARLSEQFRAATTQKIYVARVQGRVTPQRGEWTDWLWKDERRNVVSVVSAGTAGALDATLAFEVLGHQRESTLVRIQLRTGRPHQIRVQFASRGFPIWGDVKYGGPKWEAPQSIALHALSLKFQHPTTRSEIVVEAPLPDWATKSWSAPA